MTLLAGILVERQVVFVVGADGVARMRPVDLGPLADGLRVVRSGLNRSRG